jgi:hypothetical protein
MIGDRIMYNRVVNRHDRGLYMIMFLIMSVNYSIVHDSVPYHVC